MKEVTEYCRGEYKAVVHTGHTEDGLGYKSTVSESGWGKNLITLGGFGAKLTEQNINISGVCGSGNAPPSESDTILDSYIGKCSSQLLISRIVNTTPDANGYLTIECLYRSTYNPGALGASGSVNVSEAGMAMAIIAATTGLTALFSRGLLVDDLGDPTTVSVNVAVEYLDIYWKYTRYVKAETSGTKSINILGTPTDHDYIIRPARFTTATVGGEVGWWAVESNTQVKGYLVDNSGIGGSDAAPNKAKLFDGDIGALATIPSGASANYSNITAAAYSAGSKERNYQIIVSPSDGNLAGGIRSVTVRMLGGSWQVQFNPKIVKAGTPQRVLKLNFKLKLANKP